MGCLLLVIVNLGVCFAEAEGVKKATLRGTVVTTNGTPITNATVTIKKVLAGRGAIYITGVPDCDRQAVTGVGGSFAFEGVTADTKFEGVVTAPGYETRWFWDADPAKKPLQLEMVAASTADDPERMIRGRVVDPDGKPIAGAQALVHMMHTPKSWHSGGGLMFTDKEGRFIFRAREELIAADFKIEAEGYIARDYSEVQRTNTTIEYQFELNKGTSITGRVMKDGKPVPDAGIGIHSFSAGTFLNGSSVVTDENGRFTFTGVPSGEDLYLFGIMRSLRDLGALRRHHVKTGERGTRIDVGDLNLEKAYTISGRLQMADGKPARAAAFTLSRTELPPKSDAAHENNRNSVYRGEISFDNWRADPGEDGKFEFTGVPGETVSISLMLKPLDMVSPRNVSSDGRGFRLLGLVVSNKTDLIIELEPHNRQVFPPARDYEKLIHQPLQGAEAAIGK